MDNKCVSDHDMKMEHSHMNFEKIFIQERVDPQSIKTEIPDYEDILPNVEDRHKRQNFDFSDVKADEDFTKEEPHWSSQGPETAGLKPTKTISAKQKYVGTDVSRSAISFSSTRNATTGQTEKNPVNSNAAAHVDIIEVPYQADALSDEEDFDDDDMSDDENWDLSLIPSEVSGAVELPCFDEEGNSDFRQPLSKKQKIFEVSWKKGHPSYSTFSATSNGANERKEAMKNSLRNKSPVELFELFLSEELLQLICTQSVIYASQNKNQKFVLTPNCLRKFVGILLFTGYHKLPNERQYWSLDEDFDISIIREVMTRNRFIDIKRYLHFVNNEETPNVKQDKSFKIKPMVDALNKNFKQFGIFSKEISIDEQIVRNCGRNYPKQFVKDRPIRLGFRQWMMCCGTTGYCYHMELYQGKVKRSFLEQSCDTLGSKIILGMSQYMQNLEDHEIYVSNFFTSYKMLVHMRYLGIRVTGATHSNQTENCPLRSDKEIKIEGNGAYDYRFDENEEILFVKWNNISSVTVGTNHQKINPLGNVKRWSSPDQNEINIPQPLPVAKYNKFIGGVSYLDWLVQKYRIGIGSKKWYFGLFSNCLDIAVINAWVLHSAVTEEAMSLLDFKRKITRAYLQQQSVSNPKLPGRPKRYYSRIVPEVRYSPTGHTLDRTEGGKQRKCAFCKKKVSKQCGKCDVGLHMGDCYNNWHSR